MSDFPEWLAATVASDATGGRGVLPPWVRALHGRRRVVGRALTVTVSEDDNRPMREAAGRVPGPGTVLVVGGAATSRTACMGDLLARELRDAGVSAVVTDGLVRDSREIGELGLAVWCRGVTPAASRKDGPGRVGGSATVGGVLVHDGDVVVADDDGVVVWPAADVEALLVRAAAKNAADEERLRALTARRA